MELGREQLVSGSGSDLESHLAGREHFYRCVLESLGEGVLITDGDGRILFANSRAEKITGFSRAEMLGSISHELFTPSENWPAARRRLSDRMAGKEESYEHQHIRKDGSHHWVAVRAVPYRDADGKIVGSIGTLRCIEHQKGLEIENEYLREEERLNLASIVGDSPALMRVLEQIMVVAATQANVLVLGESGTGKELVARAIHEASPRAEKPLVRVNCASVPKELFESEFFGHVKGAFTGAVRDRIGRFELADGGTLFLDEVGEIPSELQAKLLRVLQDGQFERVGEERTRSVNVRIVAATNRDLPSEAKAGRFRQDLYYRLGVFPIQLPPLRDRRSDVPALAEHFVRISAKKFAVQRPKLSRSNIEDLQRYDWPGNVRELQNVIERAVILARGGAMNFDLGGAAGGALVAEAAVPAAVPSGAPASGDLTLADLDRLEREIIQRAIADSDGKVYGSEGAAAKLGLKPTTLASKLKALGLKEV